MVIDGDFKFHSSKFSEYQRVINSLNVMQFAQKPLTIAIICECNIDLLHKDDLISAFHQ